MLLAATSLDVLIGVLLLPKLHMISTSPSLLVSSFPIKAVNINFSGWFMAGLLSVVILTKVDGSVD